MELQDHKMNIKDQYSNDLIFNIKIYNIKQLSHLPKDYRNVHLQKAKHKYVIFF
jgi:hypothetical protein